MAYVAAEMEREGFDIPLLIGGATTSRVHTAVKIHPNYARGQAIHVNDASRAVGVVGALLSPETKPAYVELVRAEYRRIAEAHARGGQPARLPLKAARANALKLDWAAYQPPKPSFLGARVFRDWDLADLARFIDWTPFFHAWELKGRYPAILDDPKQGEAARQLFDDAQAMLKRSVDEKWFAPKAAIGFWPAARVGDDVRLYADDSRREAIATLFTLRQQLAKREGRPNLALADFVAPADGGPADYLGAFVVTAGVEEAAIAERFAQANDDFSSILVKALADRFAEALAEAAHARVRRALWGYAPDEALAPQDLVAEPYRGVRPAPGYPAQPDHAEKATLFRLLDAEAATGVKLTVLRDVAARVGVRALLRPPGGALLRRRPGRARPGRGLRPAQGDGARRGRALAGADPRLPAGRGGDGGLGRTPSPRRDRQRGRDADKRSRNGDFASFPHTARNADRRGQEKTAAYRSVSAESAVDGERR